MSSSRVCVQMDLYIQQWDVCCAELEYLLYANTESPTGLKETWKEDSV